MKNKLARHSHSYLIPTYLPAYTCLHSSGVYINTNPTNTPRVFNVLVWNTRSVFVEKCLSIVNGFLKFQVSYLMSKLFTEKVLQAMATEISVFNFQSTIKYFLYKHNSNSHVYGSLSFPWWKGTY